MTKKWTRFPFPNDAYVYDDAKLKKNWARLHRGDCEAYPKDPGVRAAWRHFHAGEFQQAVAAGLTAGGAGVNAAVKAQTVYASGVEKSEKVRIELLEEAAALAEARRHEAPQDANAHYFFAFALGRFSQHTSVIKAMTQGHGGKVKDALLAAQELEPRHADAHIAYGAYQAEVIEKVGALVAGVTYGARKDSAVEHFAKALELFPDSAIARVEYANGLLLMFGKTRLADATRLYQEAAAATPLDAMERLDVERAKTQLG